MKSIKFLVLTSIAFGAFAAVPLTQAATESMTADQHSAMARELQEKADVARQKVALHEAMSRHAAPKGSQAGMKKHCNQLIAQYQAEADSLAAQAAEHQRAAH